MTTQSDCREIPIGSPPAEKLADMSEIVDGCGVAPKLGNMRPIALTPKAMLRDFILCGPCAILHVIIIGAAPKPEGTWRRVR